MNQGRVVELRPRGAQGVESSESIRATEEVMRLARVISGEDELEAIAASSDFATSFDVPEHVKARSNKIAGLLKAVFFPLAERVEALEGYWRVGVELGAEDTRDTVTDRAASNPQLLAAIFGPAVKLVPPCDEDVAPLPFVSLVADPVEAIPRSAILPVEPAPDQPSAVRIERVRQLLGGTPLDVAARLLADLEDSARAPAVNGDRLALAQHLDGTITVLLAGTAHRRPVSPGVHEYERAQTEIARLKQLLRNRDEEIAKAADISAAHLEAARRLTEERDDARRTLGAIRAESKCPTNNDLFCWVADRLGPVGANRTIAELQRERDGWKERAQYAQTKLEGVASGA